MTTDGTEPGAFVLRRRDREPTFTTGPEAFDLDVISSGFGVQSVTMALLAVEGALPKPDGVIFADTHWEPKYVYRTLDRLRDVLEDAGIPVAVVSKGDLRGDTLSLDDPARVPAFVKNPDGSQGVLSRTCTDRYKLRPIRACIREALGAPHRPESKCAGCDGLGVRVAPWRAKRGDMTEGVCSICDGEGVLLGVGLPPRGLTARVWIGFSTDESDRATDRGPGYARPWHPLLELGMSRVQCEAWLARRGWTDVAKSACIGCPFHGNAMWRHMRDNDSEAFSDAVAFDAEERFRHNPGLDGESYLHRSLLPLSIAPIDFIEPKEHRAAQGDLFDELAIAEMGNPEGCSPYGCKRGDAA